MSDSRTQQILNEWRSVADAVVMSPAPPRPRSTAAPIGIALTAVSLVVIVVALSIRGHGMSPQGPAAGGPGSTPATAASSVLPVATRSPTEDASSQELDVACVASQFVLGKTTNAPGFGTLGTASNFVTQQLQNVGDRCHFNLPPTVDVATATGPFEPVSAVNAGTRSSFDVAPGASLSMVIGAWWQLPREPGGTPTAPPCGDPIRNVTRVRIPLESGGVEIALGTTWYEVCASPPHVSLTLEP